MGDAPERFDVETFTSDFAGEGRTCEANMSDRGGMVHHQGRVRLSNGWTFSALWGWGSYTDNARLSSGGYLSSPPSRSLDAEVLPMPPGDESVDLNGDTVAGWVSPAQFEAAVRAAEQNDLGAVQRILSADSDRDGSVADWAVRAFGGEV